MSIQALPGAWPNDEDDSFFQQRSLTRPPAIFQNDRIVAGYQNIDQSNVFETASQTNPFVEERHSGRPLLDMSLSKRAPRDSPDELPETLHQRPDYDERLPVPISSSTSILAQPSDETDPFQSRSALSVRKQSRLSHSGSNGLFFHSRDRSLQYVGERSPRSSFVSQTRSSIGYITPTSSATSPQISLHSSPLSFDNFLSETPSVSPIAFASKLSHNSSASPLLRKTRDCRYEASEDSLNDSAADFNDRILSDSILNISPRLPLHPQITFKGDSSDPSASISDLPQSPVLMDLSLPSTLQSSNGEDGHSKPDIRSHVCREVASPPSGQIHLPPILDNNMQDPNSYPSFENLSNRSEHFQLTDTIASRSSNNESCEAQAPDLGQRSLSTLNLDVQSGHVSNTHEEPRINSAVTMTHLPFSKKPNPVMSRVKDFTSKLKRRLEKKIPSRKFASSTFSSDKRLESSPSAVPNSNTTVNEETTIPCSRFQEPVPSRPRRPRPSLDLETFYELLDNDPTSDTRTDPLSSSRNRMVSAGVGSAPGTNNNRRRFSLPVSFRDS